MYGGETTYSSGCWGLYGAAEWALWMGSAPANSIGAAPVTLLKLEETTNLKHYTYKKPYMRKPQLDNDNTFFGSYDFSGVSANFSDHAHLRFEDWRDFLRFQTLAIEKDPRLRSKHSLGLQVVIPQLTLPDLDTNVNLILNGWKALFDGIGQKLGERLRARNHDLSVNSWQCDLYTDTCIENRNCPSSRSNILQLDSGRSVNAARVAQHAACVAAVAYQFKMRVDEGLEPDVLNEQPLCVQSVDWIFNASTALCYETGIFHVPLPHAQGPTTWEHLQDVFDLIFHASNDNLNTCTLAAGDRDAWAKVLREDEGLPEIFMDPEYQRMRPATMMTDCADWTSGPRMDDGWAMPYADHAWFHYEVMNEEARLYVKAPVGRSEDFHQDSLGSKHRPQSITSARTEVVIFEISDTFTTTLPSKFHIFN
ncbi:choline/Carnitine O-acyltransferase [Paraphaeosphaeria sporulosa]